WHAPPANAEGLKATLVDFFRKLGIAFRKVELSNGRFLWYTHELLKGLTEEEKARYLITHDEHLHALGALAEAAIAFQPDVFPKHLISVGVADIDIWSADFYAYWITIKAVWSVDRELDIQAHDLSQMAYWSKLLQHDMKERRQLLDKCRELRGGC